MTVVLTVVMTDLDGPALFGPRTPVLWAVPEAHAHQLQPCGRKRVLCRCTNKPLPSHCHER